PTASRAPQPACSSPATSASARPTPPGTPPAAGSTTSTAAAGPGRMVVVGARPGVGKTLFGTGLARAAAIKGGLPTLFKTLEMG
ncbi:hypothetical protein KBZ21_39715, partial [Streptomyces sp. A73]|nr:hypothetical protein [Streptomyces sp. A73]